MTTTSVGAPDRGFLAVTALVFAASACATVVWCASMSSMGSPWMLMPGQTLLGATAWFAVQWVVMMAAMMMPTLVPELMRARHALRGVHGARAEQLTAVTAAGYFLLWAAIGVVVFPSGLAIESLLSGHPSLRSVAGLAKGMVVAAAIALQLWRGRALRGGGTPTGSAASEISPTLGAAWRCGVRLGLGCALSSAEWTACLLVCGVMDLRVMIVVTAIVTWTRARMRHDVTSPCDGRPERARDHQSRGRAPRTIFWRAPTALPTDVTLDRAR